MLIVEDDVLVVEEVDVEEGLIKVKEAVVLIKASKQRLKEIENEQ